MVLGLAIATGVSLFALLAPSSPPSATRVMGVQVEAAAAAGAPPPATTTTVPPGPAIARRLTKFTTIRGDISPKSIVASGTGFVTAQNMMYKHSVTVYDSEAKLVSTVGDSVRLSDFGVDKAGTYRGAPVEAAFTHDGQHVYVSNYAMYGPGFNEGTDDCIPSSGVSPSFLYRISTSTWKVDQVIAVGATPKYVAVTPDDRYVLASNWCSYDLSIAETATGKVVKRIPLGAYPRGIAITPDSATAYVAVMGANKIARIRLSDFATSTIAGVGAAPRHIVLSPDAKSLYVTNNGDGRVAKIDPKSGTVVARVAVGKKPRSMAISTDGTALYNVNYESSTVSKLDAATLREVQTVPTGQHPIGITYDGKTGRVWVANYSGTIQVFDER